jgi:hypothetical protein
MSRFIAAAFFASSMLLTGGLVLVADAGFLPSAKAAAASPEAFEGRIVLVSKAALTIVAKNGDNLMFMIASDCKVTRDGKPSSVEMLGAGDRVMVAASNEADRKIAKVITACGPERPATSADAE